VEVRPPSQSDSRVATRGHFTAPVPYLLRGTVFEGRMQDGLGRPYTGRVPFRDGYRCIHSGESFDL
jgi:hypothetical protein